MLFRLISSDPLFSWRIAKHPNGASFERELSSGEGNALVKGRYLNDSAYEVVVHNSTAYFAEMLRKANAASYVTPLPFVVCPLNLRGVWEALRTAIQGQNASGGAHTNEEIAAPTVASAFFGPIPRVAFEASLRPFEELGIMAVMENSVPGIAEPNAVMVRVWMVAPMPLSTFLQKLFVVLLAVTRHLHLYERLKDAQLEKVVRLSAAWIHDAPCRNFIIKRLGSHIPGLVSKLDAAIDATRPADQAEQPEDAGEGSMGGVSSAAEAEKRISLHAQRHSLLLSHLPPPDPYAPTSSVGDPNAPLTIVDFGSSEGRLMAALVGFYGLNHDIVASWDGMHLIAVEGSESKAFRLRRKLGRRVNVIHANFVAIQDFKPIVNCDVLVMSEVIEHLCAADRALLIEQVRDFYQPEMILLTTPNIDANAELCRRVGKEWDGGFRDRDHQIEYTAQQCWDEIVAPLGKAYNIEALPLWEGAEHQPSFVLKATRRVPREELPKVHLRSFLRLSDGLYVPEVDHHVPPGDLNMGYTSYAAMANSPNIFWLGSSIAPAQWTDQTPTHLEHPLGAFEYFRTHGVRMVIEQPKLMGCRAYALAFRDPRMAEEMGFAPITLNARSGGAFFPPSHPFLTTLHNDIARGLERMGLDFAILDGEMLPWSAKDFHITRQFRMPGEAMALWRSFCEPTKLDAALRFVRTVEHFAAVGQPLSYHPFGVPAIGRIERSHGRFQFARSSIKFGPTSSPISQVSTLMSLCLNASNAIQPITNRLVYLINDEEVEQAVERWEKATEEGVEGFVYKPSPEHTDRGSMWPGVSALKVRGAEYLRIIYGADYQETDQFERLKRRQIAPKRHLSVIEDRLAEGVLRTFLAGNTTEHRRYVAAFMATDHVRGGQIDRTL